jgi:AhpC/TSA family/Disulphide bond corrector protein DsbC
MEKEGVKLAAVSYDAVETLSAFAQKYTIGYPLLSDHDSAVIRRFGIFNTNVAPGLRAHGVPHPVEYLVAADGVVVRKYFVPNYQHRVTGSAVVLKEFAKVAQTSPSVTINKGALTVTIGLSSDKAFAGQEVGFYANFTIQPEWHIYGAPLPEVYTPTSITFDDPNILAQTFELPTAEPMEIAALRETLPLYSGSFQGVGSLLLKFPLKEGPLALPGQISFQQCSDTVCEPPERVRFELALTLEPFMVARPAK